jgi:hypothetical protein
MSAVVVRMVGGKHKTRKGRGFSLSELKQAGIPLSQAVSLGLMTDLRRSSTHQQNVDTLKALAAKPRQAVVEAKAPNEPTSSAESGEPAEPRKTTKTRRTTSKKKREH